jgi:hypothetical protein
MTELDKLEKRWAELVNKPKSEAELVEQDLIAKKMKIEWAKLQNELVLELNKNGNSITTIWDLVNTKTKYPDGTVDILIKHLVLNYHDTIKEGIVRSLMVKEAKGIAVHALINEYESTDKKKHNLRWIIGCVIGYLATKEHIDWIETTILDKKNGGSRSGLIVPLVKLKDEKAEKIILQILEEDDQQLGVLFQSMEGLGLLKSSLAIEKLKTFLNHSNKEIIRHAQKILLKIS